jgi:hypothetical protein
LEANWVLRTNKNLWLIVRRLKLDSLFTDLAEFTQRDHLKASGVS